MNSTKIELKQRDNLRHYLRRHTPEGRQKISLINRKRQLARYRFSLQQYKALYVLQDGKCAICSQPEIITYRGRLRSLAVDHDHASGQVRGLLCSACNRYLGVLEWKLQVLPLFFKYLGKFSRSMAIQAA